VEVEAQCYTARLSSCRKPAMLTVLQIGRRPIPQRNRIICCRRAMNSRLMNATHVLFDRGLTPTQAKPSGKVSVVTTTLTNGRIESHHHKHLHLQPAWLVPWITLCHSRDLLCSALQLVPNSAVGCSTSFRPKTFSSASRVLSKAKG
jgi:hypothetical protein